jgi:hypothetical protein
VKIFEEKPMGDDADSDAPGGEFPQNGRGVFDGRHVPEQVPLGNGEAVQPVIAAVFFKFPLFKAKIHFRGQGIHGPVEPFGGYSPHGPVKIADHAVQVHAENKAAFIHK